MYSRFDEKWTIVFFAASMGFKANLTRFIADVLRVHTNTEAITARLLHEIIALFGGIFSSLILHTWAKGVFKV